MKCRIGANNLSPPSVHGIALVATLWVTSLLALLAATLSLHSRLTGDLTLNMTHSSRAELAAQAGLHWAYWGLQVPESQDQWLADASFYEMPFSDMLIQVAVTDENGKIDLNQADSALLNSLFKAQGLEDMQAESLADAILDWRDRDNLKRLNGAEDEDYIAAGLNWQSKDADFESVLELKKVLGMSEEIFRSIVSGVTVYSGRRTINPLVAPRAALMAVSSMDEVQANQFIEERRQLHQQGQKLALDAFNSAYISTTMRGLNYTVHTQALIKPYTKSRMSVVVQRRGEQGKGVFKILEILPSSDVFPDTTGLEQEQGVPRE